MWTCSQLCQKAASPQCKSSCRRTCTLWVKRAKEADENTGFCTTQFTALVDPCILFWLRFEHPVLIYRIFIVPGLSYVKTYMQAHLSMQLHWQKKPHPGILSLLKLQEWGEQVPCGSWDSTGTQPGRYRSTFPFQIPASVVLLAPVKGDPATHHRPSLFPRKESGCLGTRELDLHAQGSWTPENSPRPFGLDAAPYRWIITLGWNAWSCRSGTKEEVLLYVTRRKPSLTTGIKPSGSDFCAFPISLGILSGNKGVFGMLCSSDLPLHVNSIPVVENGVISWSFFKSSRVCQYRLISI